MSHRLIYDLRLENLCSHFVLPLLKLSKYSFLQSNFVNSYLTKNRDYIVVEVLDLILVPFTVYKRHPDYVGKIRRDDRLLLIYKIPTKWYYTVLLFTQGRFSRMPDDAKEAIKIYSKLSDDDGRILALTKDKSLKDLWERELLVYIDDDMELLSKPDGEGNYIDIRVK